MTAGSIRPLRLRVLGSIEEGLVPEEIARSPLPVSLDSEGRVPVRTVLREHGGGPVPVVLLTSYDLSSPGCRRLFGYADRRRRAAIVSTFHLRSSNQATLRRRVANVMAHEIGHLDGRGHCSDPQCVMRPARNAADVDARGMELCPRCRKRPARRYALTAVAAILLAVFGLDAITQAFHRRSKPFSWREQDRAAYVLYQKEPVLTLADSARARAAAQSLNELFLALSPPPLEVVPAGETALVRAGARPVLEIQPADAAGSDPVSLGRSFAARIEPLLRGKGAEHESCPSCHIYRLQEVEQAARDRVRLWR